MSRRRRADRRLRNAEIVAVAKLEEAKGPAAVKLREAFDEAQSTLRRAEGPADAKLRKAEFDADAKLRSAEIPAHEIVERAKVVADATLQRAQTNLQRDAFERFFSLSLDMMCIQTADARFERVSPSFDALGHTPGDLLGMPLLDFIHPDDAAATRSALERRTRGETVRFENRFRCKDGAYRWLSWVSGPDSAGTLYSVVRDVTDTRRSQEALALAKDNAEAASRELESFSYSVAHDLRTPLRSIDGFSQALLEDFDDKLDADGKRYLSFIRQSAQHMAHLIDDLLALSRITRAELRRAPVDLSALAHAVFARLQRADPERTVTVSVEEGLCCLGDARLLGVVLDNLLSNAWKFTARRENAHIEVGAEVIDGRVAYFVRDNGAGFDMAYADKLFGVFQRLHRADEFEGTGVGLATVQRVLRRHGGRVWAEGADDKGATYRFTLEQPEPPCPSTTTA